MNIGDLVLIIKANDKFKNHIGKIIHFEDGNYTVKFLSSSSKLYQKKHLTNITSKFKAASKFFT